MRRQHADDRARFAVERECLPDDVCTRTEAPLPKLITDDDGCAARLFILRDEGAAQDGLHVE